MSKAKATKLANQHNATIDDDGTNINIDAPDGHEWADGSGSCLSVEYGTFIGCTKSEAWADLIDRMGYGVESA